MSAEVRSSPGSAVLRRTISVKYPCISSITRSRSSCGVRIEKNALYQVSSCSWSSLGTPISALITRIGSG
ncbi:Uncharacterised protein [Mycobacteroides abscessus subsp. abscessus]|nr:Uncharacterised protein [Mycobacteroides abscessus subsp. abscessus]